MSHGETIARNAAWLMGATVAQKFLSFVSFTIIANIVGVEITGAFFFAVSVTSVFVILGDLGMTPLLIREIASDVSKGLALLKRILMAKCLLVPFAIIATLAYASISHVERETLVAILVACFVMSADTLSLTWYGVVRGCRKLSYEAIGMLVGQIWTVVVSLTFALLLPGPTGLVAGLLAGSLWNACWSWYSANKLTMRERGSASYAWSWERLIQFAWPFALAGIFVRVYSYIDTLLLKAFHDDAAVGYYAVAYKLTYAFQFLPLTFVAALYPGLSAIAAKKDREAMERVLQGSMRLMLLTGMPIAVFLSAFAQDYVPILYRQGYNNAIAPLKILPWVLIPIFFDYPIGSLLNATNRAKQKTITMGITMIVNALLNTFLVPTYGPIGAAWAALGSLWVLFLSGLWFAWNDFMNHRWLLSLLSRGGLVAGVIWYTNNSLQGSMNFISRLIVAILLYVGGVITLRLVTKNDKKWITYFTAKSTS